MTSSVLSFDHVHIISKEPDKSAQWYVDMLDARMTSEQQVRGALQVGVELGGVTILLRGKRVGENPNLASPIQHFGDYSSHNEWGVDHLGFIYQGDLKKFCDEIRERGVTFAVEPIEFLPGTTICYVSAPDNVTIELIQK